MHIRPLPQRRRPLSHDEAMSLLMRTTGPALAVFGMMFLFFLVGR